MGMRVVIGVIFIAHGSGKFDPGFAGFLSGPLGLPAEMQIPIALAELVPVSYTHLTLPTILLV